MGCVVKIYLLRVGDTPLKNIKQTRERRIHSAILLETIHIPKTLKNFHFFVTFFLFLQLIIIEGNHERTNLPNQSNREDKKWTRH